MAVLVSYYLATAVQTARLERAFAQVESSNNPYAVGDHGRAKGLFQFHRARWKELSSAPWPGTPTQQRAAFRKFLWLNRNLTLTQLANKHNLGHVSNKRTKYVERIYHGLRHSCLP